MDSKLIDQIVRAKKRGVPFVALMTHDPKKAAEEICDVLGKKEILSGGKPRPLTSIHWDVSQGLYSPSNKDWDKRGAEWIQTLIPPKDESSPFGAMGQQEETENPCAGEPTLALEKLKNAPSQSVIFYHQANRWLNGESNDCRATIQAASNLRNIYKSSQRMIVFLATSIILPEELRSDTLIFDDPLPKAEQLSTLFKTHKILGDAVPNKKDQERAAAFVTGCSWFGAEQSLYLSLKKENGKTFLDLDELRGLRHSQIEQNRGLHVIHSDATFDDVAGNDWMKSFLTRVMNGNDAPNGIINIEEINWAMAGAKGDNTGVSADQVQVVLDHMEKHGDEGIIFFGVPGCSKSWLVETMGKTFGVDTLQLDLNGLKQAEVGTSEAHIRQALKVADAVCGGKKLWIATCNSVEGLDEALLRRFTYGIVFFDLPTKDEKKGIWKIQLKRYNLSKEDSVGWEKVDTNLWSAADIRNCCRNAYKLKQTVLESATEINPVARQKPLMVPSYRKQAHQCYRESHTGKLYVWDNAPKKTQPVVADDRDVSMN